MKTATEELVISVIARRSGRRADEISHDTRLLQDLKLDGDDAVDALLEISKNSSLNLDGFDVDKYFNPEPNILSILRPKKQKEELTVGQIISAAHLGHKI